MSSAIAAVDSEGRIVTTSSGRQYELLGPRAVFAPLAPGRVVSIQGIRAQVLDDGRDAAPPGKQVRLSAVQLVAAEDEKAADQPQAGFMSLAVSMSVLSEHQS
ncbi:MAG: hypothetical protein IV092_18040 [Burkholderiaceae bacterium]|nr:hypothetical protein [Burkholderiaceae bacterium]